MCHSNIGDFCHNLVVVSLLRRQFPASKISVLTSSRSESIARGYDGLDEIVVFDGRTKDRGLIGGLRRIISLRKKRYDLVIILKNSLMHKFLGIPVSWSLRKYLGGRRLSDTGKHAVDSYLGFLMSHGVTAPEARFGFTISGTDRDFSDRLMKEKGIKPDDKLVGILPLAGWSLKSWPIDKWNGLARILKERCGIKMIAFGDNDNALFRQIVLKNISPDIILTGRTTLTQAMAVIKRCDLFIAPDSGPLHLASIMGVDAIGLYGPCTEEYMYPYFHRNNTISAGAKLSCMPCYPGLTNCICHKKRVTFGDCMERISVDDVLEAAKRTKLFTVIAIQ